MPLYEYQCSKCENRFEALVMNAEDEAEVECDACQSTKVFRVVAPFAVCGLSASGETHAGCGGAAPGPGKGRFS